MKVFPKVTTVDTTKLQPGEHIHMEFSLYNVTYIQSSTSIFTVVCARTRTIRLFPIAPKRSQVEIICFILTTFNNKQHPCRCVRVDEY